PWSAPPARRRAPPPRTRYRARGRPPTARRCRSLPAPTRGSRKIPPSIAAIGTSSVLPPPTRNLGSRPGRSRDDCVGTSLNQAEAGGRGVAADYVGSGRELMDASGPRARAKDRGWAGAIVVLAGVLTISG